MPLKCPNLTIQKDFQATANDTAVVETHGDRLLLRQSRHATHVGVAKSTVTVVVEFPGTNKDFAVSA